MYSPELLAAVAVLDKDQPGWWRKVDTGKGFHLMDCQSCVLGQIYGNGQPEDSVPLEDTGWAIGMKRTGGLPGVFSDHERFADEWRSLIAARNEADRIGETLSIPDLESEAVEGHERVLA
jgi:hypothetical protein